MRLTLQFIAHIKLIVKLCNGFRRSYKQMISKVFILLRSAWAPLPPMNYVNIYLLMDSM